VIDAHLFIETIDGFLAELGTTGLVDARKARDQLMDLRLMFMSLIPEIPDTIESISAPLLNEG
jgi:hypothetical protein